MKKLLAVLLAMVLLLSLAACGGSKDDTKDDGKGDTQAATNPAQNNDSTPTTPSQGGEQNAPQPSQPAATNPTTPATPNQDSGSADTHSHAWDYTKAQITKQPSPAEEGSQTVPCSGCNETMTETMSKLATDRCFTCAPLGAVVSGTEAEGQNCMTAETIVAYMLVTKEGTFTQSSADFFAECGKHFALTDSLKSGIKAVSTATFSYNAAADQFTYTAEASVYSTPLIKGFVHNGGNKYTVYYYNSNCGCWVDDCMLCLKPFHFKVELELNRGYNDMNAINKILSITKIKSAPDDLSK